MRFLNNRVFRVLMTPTRAGLRAVNVATQLLLRTISRVVGGEVVRDAVAFFTAFEGMEQGFRDRAGQHGDACWHRREHRVRGRGRPPA